MGTEANKDVVRRLFRALGDGRMDDVGDLFAENIRWWILGIGDVPIEALKEAWSRMFTPPPGADVIKIIAMTAEADRVAIEIVSDFELPDGRDYHTSCQMQFVVRDGRIAAAREYMDTAYSQKMFGDHREELTREVEPAALRGKEPHETIGR